MMVATVLDPFDRNRVEAAGHGCYTVVHGDSIDEAAQHVRHRQVDALFLSVHRCGEADLPRVARFVREFPSVPAVALLSRSDAGAADRILRLGASGVRAVVDLSTPGGWQRLRDLLREPTAPVVAAVMAAIQPELEGVPTDCRIYFELLMRRAPETTTAVALARSLGTVPSSLMSRFLRAGLPSPRIYLAHARLLHAAWLFSDRGLKITDVALRLDYSSPQSFGRHLRALLGMTAGEFRRRYPFPEAVARFRAAFLTPYRDRLLAFHPLGTMPGDLGQPVA
jgi:AraC-like DNA-binding protein